MKISPVIAERLNRMLHWIGERETAPTLREICESEGLKITPHSRRLVETLETDGFIVRRQIPDVYPVTYTYSLSETGQEAERLGAIMEENYE